MNSNYYYFRCDFFTSFFIYKNKIKEVLQNETLEKVNHIINIRSVSFKKNNVYHIYSMCYNI